MEHGPPVRRDAFRLVAEYGATEGCNEALARASGAAAYSALDKAAHWSAVAALITEWLATGELTEDD